MKQDDFSYAARFRDAIRRITRAEINRERPRAALATVITVNVTNKIAYVLFPGENSEAPVSLGALIPDPGATVLVDGPSDGRYVSDIVSGTFRLSNEIGPAGPPGPPGPPGAGSGSSIYLGTWPGYRGNINKANSYLPIPPNNAMHFALDYPTGDDTELLPNNATWGIVDNHGGVFGTNYWYVMGRDSTETFKTTHDGKFAGVRVTIPSCEFIMADFQGWAYLKWSSDSNQYMPGSKEPVVTNELKIALTHNNRLWDNHNSAGLVNALDSRIPSGGFAYIQPPALDDTKQHSWQFRVQILASPKQGFGTLSESLFDSGVGNEVDIGFALRQPMGLQLPFTNRWIDVDINYAMATIWAIGVT